MLYCQLDSPLDLDSPFDLNSCLDLNSPLDIDTPLNLDSPLDLDSHLYSCSELLTEMKSSLLIEDTIDDSTVDAIKVTADNDSKNDNTEDFAIDYVDNQNIKCGTLLILNHFTEVPMRSPRGSQDDYQKSPRSQEIFTYSSPLINSHMLPAKTESLKIRM